MPKYQYTAVDSQGRPVSGKLQAAGPREALDELAAGGLGAETICLSEMPAPVPPGGRLSAEEAVELAGQVAELAKAGLPLGPGLRALADELPVGRLPSVLREMAGQLEAGSSLDSVIETQGARFPAHVRGLVLAGVRSGHLAEALEEFVDLQRETAELWRRVWLSLAYPALLMVFLSIVFIFQQDYLVPQFTQIYGDFGVDLPVVTRVFLRSSGMGLWLLESLVVLLVATLALCWGMSTLTWASRVLYAIPLIGPLWRWSRLAQFARWMGLLLKQNVPLPEALRVTAAGLREASLARACRQVAEEVEAGRPLSEGLLARRQFPASLVPLVQWGQQAPELAGAFQAAAEMFQGRIQSQRSFLEMIVAPLVFLFVAGFISFFVIAVLLPLISLISMLS